MRPADRPGGSHLPSQERQKPDLLARAEPLRGGPLEVLGRLPFSSNGTFLVRAAAEPDPVLGVYKPARGERPLYDFPLGSLYRREVAAFVLSHALGWRLVPPTFAREDAPLGPGSVQLFVDHDQEQHYFTLLPGRKAVFRRLATFDILCNNADRKSGHCLLGADGEVWAIDHGLTFHVEPKLRTVIWDFAGEPVGRRERAAIARVALALGDPAGALWTDLSALITPAELAALGRRARRLAEPSVYPQPDSSWSFPWPLV